jgi:hypothetical protein
MKRRDSISDHTGTASAQHAINRMKSFDDSWSVGAAEGSCQQTRNACDQSMQHVACFGKELPWINLPRLRLKGGMPFFSYFVE